MKIWTIFTETSLLTLVMLLGRAFRITSAMRYITAPLFKVRLPISMRLFSGTGINTEIMLQQEEKELFDMLTKMVEEKKMGTTIRIAGGWVRDKLLGAIGKEDIDVALDNLTGVEFAQALSEWNEENGGESIKFGVIQQNPDKSKHLETATITLGKYQVDFVNLRTEKYTDSRIPIMEIGTPQQDAERRDLTINSLFYNVNEQKIEDFTGSGLADLRSGLARTPLDPLTTLIDDPLRALRAVRFCCRFQLTAEPELVKAICNPTVQVALGSKVSRERIFVETKQMMQHLTGAPRAALLLHELRLIQHILCLPTHDEVQSGEQELMLSPEDKLCSTIVCPYDADAEVVLPLKTLHNAYHDYGTIVAITLALYDRTIGPIEDREVYKEDESSLRGLLNFAALSLYGANAKCLRPGRSSSNQIKRNYMPLNHYVFQKLKMRAKDIDTIQAMQESALVIAQLLRVYMKTPGDSEIENESGGVPLTFKGVSRLEIGLALRDAGQLSEQALRLAVAALLVENLHSDGAHYAESLAYISSCYFGSNNVFLASFHCKYNQNPSPLDILLDKTLDANKAECIRRIKAAACDFRKARCAMQLENVHREQPLLNGKSIKKVKMDDQMPYLFPNQNTQISLFSHI